MNNPFLDTNSDPLVEAAKTILEKVSIAAVTGYGKSVPSEIQEHLQTILNSADSPKGSITRAKFFDSGYYGVSFMIGGREYNITMNMGKLGSDDYVRGNMTLTKTGDSKPILVIKGDDKLNSGFPTMSDLGKMTRAVSDLIRR